MYSVSCKSSGKEEIKSEIVRSEDEANRECQNEEAERIEETKVKAAQTVPVEGSVKWEMSANRTSSRTKEKHDWLGQHVMVA